MNYTVPEHLLLTEEDFLPSTIVVKTREQMTEAEYQAELRKDGCYDLDDEGNSFYD